MGKHADVAMGKDGGVSCASFVLSCRHTLEQCIDCRHQGDEIIASRRSISMKTANLWPNRARAVRSAFHPSAWRPRPSATASAKPEPEVVHARQPYS